MRSSLITLVAAATRSRRRSPRTPPSGIVELSGPRRDPWLFQVRSGGGALIPRDESHASGWDCDAGSNTITFYGAECTAVESGSVASVDVDLGCSGPLI